ncbi:hypothetical protein [Sphingobacterium siyangense]|uniref:AAA domain-containing protein n=1 Tax=Sphingobacterium siyangense TaxID=459529 RepID=A0A562MC65_9SPHI|nr:hypothetical protein [Sphingobacterium siyangense]TWI17509.1 hypothetical protein IQ31_03655 [Sphingobacterium siyangense]
METLINFQDILLQGISNDFRRYLHEKINWNQRMIGIKGTRGAGKTTLLLQHMKYDLGALKDKSLYIDCGRWYRNWFWCKDSTTVIRISILVLPLDH